MKNVLVLAAHPDDEILGCGASMARLISNGYKVSVQIFGEGPTSRSSSNFARQEAEAAAQVIGFDLLDFFNLKDQEFDQHNFLELAKKTTKLVEQIQPEILFTHHPKDLNRDHRIVSELACVVSRATPECKIKEVYFWENLSSFEWSPNRHEFRPQMYFDVSQHIEKKVQALKAYASEIRDFPHPRSEEGVRSLSKVRGSESGFLAAEAFEVFRITRGSGH